MIGAGLLRGVSEMRQADAEADAMLSAAGAARREAEFMRQQAIDATVRGRLAASLQRMEGSRVIGAQRVGAAAGGVAGGVGTAARLQEEARFFSQMDARTLEENAAREAYALQFGRQQRQREAADLTRRSVQTRAAGMVRGGTTFLGTALDAQTMGSAPIRRR